MSDCGMVIHTGYCLTLSATCAVWGMRVASKVPAIVLIKTSAILYPVIALVALATRAIFADFNHPAKELIIHFGTIIYSHKFTVFIASGFGIASATVWTVYLIALLLLAGLTTFYSAFLPWLI